jgi:hypothetical protein
MATIFPDVESLLVARIKSALTTLSAPVTAGVTVAVKKPAPDVSPYPAKIVTVRADGGQQILRGLVKEEMIGINVFANNYKNASDLARYVESIMRVSNWGDIKLIETTMSPVRVENDAKEEQRYMTFRVVVKASDG